jgi:excisionase family DNA binding protein
MSLCVNLRLSLSLDFHMSINFLTVEAFAERMQMSKASIRRLIREGRIFAVRPGSGKTSPYRISETELERLHVQGMCERKD